MSTQNPFGYYPPATADTSPAAQTAAASTSSFAMQGLAALITPITPTANVLCIISGYYNAGAITVGNGCALQLYYGPISSGTAAPANAAAVPASAVAVGPVMKYATGVTLTTAADAFSPVVVHGVVKGLIPGQQYWFDVAAESINAASQNQLLAPHVTLCEIG
jgi:hypothetical protein